MSNRPHRHFEHEMIQSPGRRLMHQVPLRFVQRRVAGGGGRNVNAGLNLTSFIDFLIVVVVFLLMSFSASGEIPVDKNTKLPSAENTVDMLTAPVVAIARSQILVDGVQAGSTRTVEDNGVPGRIEELGRVLDSKRETWSATNPGKPFPGVVVLQVDKRVPAVVVKSVFETAIKAKYQNVSFMVGQIPRAANAAPAP